MRIEYQLNIKAPIEMVYQVSQDYSVRYEWDSFPENIRLLNDAKNIGKGVSVAITAKSGLKMEVEFVQLMAPTTATITMINGPAVLQAFSGSWVFKSVSAAETNAKFIYSIKTKWWSVPYLSEFIASWYFSKIIRSRLHGLKAYCETMA